MSIVLLVASLVVPRPTDGSVILFAKAKITGARQRVNLGALEVIPHVRTWLLQFRHVA